MKTSTRRWMKSVLAASAGPPLALPWARAVRRPRAAGRPPQPPRRAAAAR